MPHPDELLLEDVRCFRGEQRARLRPITLLVGENSTGKTTLLGCYATLHGMFSTRFGGYRADFNREPFSLGSFRDIARPRRNRPGAARRFKIGFGVPKRGDGAPSYELIATFAERGSQPALTSWRYGFSAGGFLEIRQGGDNRTAVAIEGYETEIGLPFERTDLRFLLSHLGEVGSSRYPCLEPVVDFVRTVAEMKTRDRHSMSSFLLPDCPPVVPVAPLRATPRRTYDPTREAARPDGAHVPMLMMRLHHEGGPGWKSLQAELSDFGRASGLFSEIRVKRHGKRIGDPFQLQVRAHSGSHANLMDVGYGVSQSLWILVDLLGRDPNDPQSPGTARPSLEFLLQQPEVHLHPRGQAELASFFVESVRKMKYRFLIETHSDYIVDRIRISVRQKKIAADEVSILYFEPKRNAVEVHNLLLDEYGNIENAPPGYRDFFLRETDTLLGFER